MDKEKRPSINLNIRPLAERKPIVHSWDKKTPRPDPRKIMTPLNEVLSKKLNK